MISDNLDFYINRKINIIETYTRGELEINYGDLVAFDRSLGDSLKNDPDKFLEVLRSKIYERFLNLNLGETRELNITITGVTPYVMIKDISSKHEGKAISFYGLIVRRSEIEPMVEMNRYICMSCNRDFTVAAQQKSPGKCIYCNSKRIQLASSTKRDVQYLDIQELIERTEPGVPAPKVKCIVTGSMINTVLPGEIVEITGVLRLIQTQTKRNTNLSKLIEIKGIRKMQTDFNSIQLNEKDREEILRFSRDPDALYKFATMVFPDIYGYEDVKRAIILQLIGGNRKRTRAGTRLRPNIHILLIGDPGIAKSRILQQVAKISPKAIYVSGKSASGVGLTATVEKDEYVGWTLKAGAAVLASGGVVAIDEFDKLDDEEKSALHEVMESGTVSIAKAGIVATLVADTTILAAANPKYGRFSLKKRIIDQFNIPPSLLTRFDLIFPLVDEVNPASDEKLADAILSMHKTAGFYEYDPSFLRKYISYARRQNPRLTDGAIERIKRYYITLREEGASKGNVAITPRYLEGMIRLAEAHAKFRMSDRVDVVDADVGIGLMKKVIESVLKDPETGEVSVDTIMTGMTYGKRAKIETVYNIIKELFQKEGIALKRKVREIAQQRGVTSDLEFEDIITTLINQGDIFQRDSGENAGYGIVE
ncbi:MAG: minichromosome maintenance protein MCM [Candidatus Micrarchaeota archaeon]|nr:minichromosome maintenance protein MCM [Candidatus Micrarchaeota archaeon]MCX8154281.1 minichromosome maintenance protein MCM [Candidatus Micrarchaeota archaeon]